MKRYKRLLPFSGAILLFLLRQNLFAQELAVEGMVLDRDTKQRLTGAFIKNIQTGLGLYNNSRGEFRTKLFLDCVLEASLKGYQADTLSANAEHTVLIFYLKRQVILLPEVHIKERGKSPQAQFRDAREVYSSAYALGDGRSSLLQDRGFGIDGLYSLFSREGRNARHLQALILGDYQWAVVSSRYNSDLVSRVTGLRGQNLIDFMQQYRPNYDFVLRANDYEMVRFIKYSYQFYTIDSTALRLPALKRHQ